MLKNIYRLCVVCCLLLSLSMAGTASVWAEEVYTVTEAELQLLETNLTKLEAFNKELQRQIKEQKSLINQAKFDLTEQAEALSKCKQELSQAQSSLENANQLLKQYAKEEKLKLRKAKRQRTIWCCVGVALTAGVTYKFIKERKILNL